jgi:hypothetical protein
MEPTAVTRLKPEIRTPLVAGEWSRALEAAGITHRYPLVPLFISRGADAGIPQIHSTFVPPNHPSILEHQEVFTEIVDIEFVKGRYWGPYLSGLWACLLFVGR